MTIDEIYKKEEISVRSYHVCKYNELHSVSDLKQYYRKNKSFEKLRNCGRKSNKELIEIFNKYQDDYVENREMENPLKSIILNLTRVQREVVNSFIFVNTNTLSVRSKNAISLHLKGNLKVKNFAEKILLSEKFNINNIKNIGAKCVPELEVFISIIKDFIFEVNESNDEKYLITLKNKFLIHQTFSIPLIPVEILESESIFSLTNFLLDKNALFDKTQTTIVKDAFKLYDNQEELKLDDIATKVDLSRERVRQIRKLCLEELLDKLKFIQNFNDDLFQKYGLDIASNFLEINLDVIEKINASNNTNLSREFITYILYAYLDSQFYLIGNYEDVFQPTYFNSRNRHNWNNFYLVKKGIALEIDFNALANDIDNRINDRIEESYSFNFKSYLSKFLTNNNIDVLDLLFPICEKIVNDEFQLYLDLDENLNFKRNTNRQVHEYAYEALEQLGKPSKVKEIFEKVIELHPNYDTEEAKIRVSMKRKNGFVPIGRKSVFGLKKWEKELENFKGGTIKEIVIQFLEKNNTPIHISSILKEVNKYRTKTNERNIITNLKLDPNNSFIIFNQKFIGLTNMKSHYDLEKYKKLPVQLGKYIIGKYKSGYSINDIKLHCNEAWGLTIQESELIIQNLKYFKQTKTNNISSYTKNKIPKIEYSFDKGAGSKYSLKDLFKFISENQRMPDSRDPNERNLYQFYYRNKKELENNGSFDPEQLELKGLIRQYGISNRGSKYSLDDLFHFIRKNQRMPDSRNPNEKNLYQFYYRKKKELENNVSLNKEQLELKKLIEQYGRSGRGSKYNLSNLIAFIEENQRLPYSGDSDEIKLYRFLHRKIRKFTQSSSLSNEELNLKIIIEKYQSTSQRQSHSIEGLIDFILKKQRIPHSRDPDEKNLYQFYYRNKKELESNVSLNKEQLELKKLIEQYGRSSRGSNTAWRI